MAQQLTRLLAGRLSCGHFPYVRRRSPSQLQRAVPMLNDADLQGTFYINPRGDDFLKKLAPWRDVAKAGHEIGNHSIAHICSRGFHREPTARGLENMTLDDLEKDIVEAKRRLQQIVPEQEEMSFAYPCYMEHVGCGPTRQSYVPSWRGITSPAAARASFLLRTIPRPWTCTMRGRGRRSGCRGRRWSDWWRRARSTSPGASSRFTASTRVVWALPRATSANWSTISRATTSGSGLCPWRRWRGGSSTGARRTASEIHPYETSGDGESAALRVTLLAGLVDDA